MSTPKPNPIPHVYDWGGFYHWIVEARPSACAAIGEILESREPSELAAIDLSECSVLGMSTGPFRSDDLAWLRDQFGDRFYLRDWHH